MNNMAEREALTEGVDASGAPLLSTPPAGQPYKQIWAIGGGKGGVGKTLITANFAITLAKAGASVTLVDLDLGGANLHTCLGVEQTTHTLSDLFSPDVKNLNELATPTQIPNLSLISGAQDSLNVANLPHA